MATNAKAAAVSGAHRAFQGMTDEQKNDAVTASNTGAARLPGESEGAYQKRAAIAGQQLADQIAAGNKAANDPSGISNSIARLAGDTLPSFWLTGDNGNTGGASNDGGTGQSGGLIGKAEQIGSQVKSVAQGKSIDTITGQGTPTPGGNYQQDVANFNADYAAHHGGAMPTFATPGNPAAPPGSNTGQANFIANQGGGGGGSGIDTSSLSAAIANSRALQNQYNQPITPLSAPTASASLIGPVERAQAAQIAAYQAAQEVGPIQAGIASAGQSQAAQIAATALAQKQAAIQAERVQAALAQQQGDITAERVGAAQADRTVLGPTALASGTQLAPTALADQTTIDALKQAEFRQGQEGLVTGLQGAVAGTDPSVAAIMLRQATERNQANQFGMAQAASGGNVGFALRQAMLNSADINQQSIGQQALLRAQEIATARGQLGSVLSSGRESDIGLATSQANLSQQQKLANAGFTNTASMTQAQLDQAIKLANAGFKNTATTTQAQLDQATNALNVTQKNQVNLANANNALEAAKTNVTLAQQVALANQSAENTAALQNAQNALAAATKNAELAQQVALSNQSALNNTSQVNAQLSNATGIANAGNVTQASVATANNQTSAANTTASLDAAIRQTNATNQSNTNTKQADLSTQTALANALASNNAATTNANNSTSVSRDNANNAVTTNSQNITQSQNAASNTLTASGQQVTAAAAKASADAAAKQAATQKSAAEIAAGGAVAGALLSDRRVKKNIRRADAEISALLGSIKPYGYKYKDPKATGAASGKQFGLMAQDLEKSKAGKTLVHNTPGGKMVDTNRAVLAALAALGSVDKRLKNVERKAA